MAIATIVTRGYGSFGSIAAVALRGYAPNEANIIHASESLTMYGSRTASLGLTGVQAAAATMRAARGASFTAIMRNDP